MKWKPSWEKGNASLPLSAERNTVIFRLPGFRRLIKLVNGGQEMTLMHLMQRITRKLFYGVQITCYVFHVKKFMREDEEEGKDEDHKRITFRRMETGRAITIRSGFGPIR
jgi:hypothetical protein